MRVRGAAALIGAAALMLAGALTSCASGAGSSSGDGSSGAAEQITLADQTVTVYAAASLKRAFDELKTEFEAEHEGMTIEAIVYDGSSTLATQIVEGAPADVFASADEKNMAVVDDEGLAESPELFATNTLVVAVPAGNPAGVTSLADLAKVKTVLCAEEVPCGAASVKLLDAAGVTVKAASLEQNVTAVLEKVAAGEADAGLVYATDVIGDDAVESFVPEGADQVVNRYPITALTNAGYPEAAQAFVDFVLGDAGQSVLKSYGFGSAG
ncbi:MAG: molybdate ABC transporter substrate-binding protein [Leucobacter sp.]|nr:molybdate ABC transporter substrate-binding protein [Leucobacter sp.]